MSLRDFMARHGTALLVGGAIGGLLLGGMLWGRSERVPERPSSPRTTAATPAKPGAALDVMQQLMEQQSRLSDSANRASGAASAGAGQAQSPLVPPLAPGHSASPAEVRGAQQQARMTALRNLQSHTVADILAVPPGDTKKLIAVMDKFNVELREAGAPPVLDMDKLHKMLEGVDRMKALNTQLVAEAMKGRDADTVKVQALSKEIASIQAAMPKQFVNPAVMGKVLAGTQP